MKICKKCGENDQEKFYKAYRGLYCMTCCNEKGRERNKTGQNRNNKAKLERKECFVCKLAVTEETTHHFEWDHINPSEKEHLVSKLNHRTDKLFFDEIAKCNLLCLFCHADRTKDQVKNGHFPKGGRPKIY